MHHCIRGRTSPMIESLHPSVLHVILCALPAASNVRLATCSQYLCRTVMHSKCRAIRLPILRERLKDACWSIVRAGYDVNVRDTLASCISGGNIRGNPCVTFTYNHVLHAGDDTISPYASDVYPRYKRRHHDPVVQSTVSDVKTFGEVFDMCIVHAKARLKWEYSPNIRNNRNKTIDKHFVRCEEQWRCASFVRDTSIPRAKTFWR